jgi:hypothetical protein
MSEVLARLRVREAHGIRRFLYPLSAAVRLPQTLKMGESKTSAEMYGGFALQTLDGHDVPRQITSTRDAFDARLDFALSLAPGETSEVLVVTGPPVETVPDPLQVTPTLDGGVKNTQQRFTVVINPEGGISEVVYDGVRALRGPGRILRNEEAAWHSSTTAWNSDPSYLLYSQLRAKSRYKDGGFAQTQAALTACKSWVTVTHTLEQPKPADEVVFTLPLAVTSPTLTCDFGAGGGVYGKLQAGSAPEVVWRSEFGEAPHARWSVATAGREDYVGQVETADAFRPQQWFHLIDSDKALAVAVTQVPAGCRAMTVRLTHEGDVSVAFRLGDAAGPATFGVCYHFLNDVPALAAATNPQSILLPPVVEVLPA